LALETVFRRFTGRCSVLADTFRLVADEEGLLLLLSTLKTFACGGSGNVFSGGGGGGGGGGGACACPSRLI